MKCSVGHQSTSKLEQFFSVVFLQPPHLFKFGHSPDKDKLSASPLNLKNDAQTTEWDNHSDHLLYYLIVNFPRPDHLLLFTVLN